MSQIGFRSVSERRSLDRLTHLKTEEADVLFSSKAWLAQQSVDNATIGQIISQILDNRGLECSHLCGTGDCIRASHGHYERSQYVRRPHLRYLVLGSRLGCRSRQAFKDP